MQTETVGMGARVIHFLVDTIIIAIVAILVFRTYNPFAYYYRLPFLNFWWIFFAIQFLYYFLLEMITKTTIGKMLAGSKLVSEKGEVPNLYSILIRTIVRLFPFDILGFPLYNAPFHDAWSKTKVVEK